MSTRRGIVDADLLVLLWVSTLDTDQQFVLDVLRELDTDRIVFVSELLANVTRVGPRRLGARVWATEMRGVDSPGW